MPILHIQHAVPNFDGWKRAFDSDPMDRKGSGVRRYHVHRAVADPNFVMIDLELDTLPEAERLLEKLRYLSPTTDPFNRPRLAPSAIRMPISFVRSVTMKASRP